MVTLNREPKALSHEATLQGLRDLARKKLRPVIPGAPVGWESSTFGISDPARVAKAQELVPDVTFPQNGSMRVDVSAIPKHVNNYRTFPAEEIITAYFFGQDPQSPQVLACRIKAGTITSLNYYEATRSDNPKKEFELGEARVVIKPTPERIRTFYEMVQPEKIT